MNNEIISNHYEPMKRPKSKPRVLFNRGTLDLGRNRAEKRAIRREYSAIGRARAKREINDRMSAAGALRA